MKTETKKTAKELYHESVTWYGEVQNLPDEEYQALVTMLINDLNDDEFFVRELISAKLDLIRFNRKAK